MDEPRPSLIQRGANLSLVRFIRKHNQLRRLRSNDARTRLEAIGALVAIGGEDVIEELIGALRRIDRNAAHEDAEVIELAVALTKLDGESAVPLLTEWTASASGASQEVKLAATKAIASLAHRDSVGFLIDSLSERLPKEFPLMPQYERSAVSSEGDDLAALISTLGEMRDPRAMDPLIRALGKQAVRTEAIKALGELGDKRAADYLVAQLGTPWRQHALVALRQIGERKWLTAYDFGPGYVRELAKVGGKRATPALINVLFCGGHVQKESEVWENRMEALNGLCKIKDDRATYAVLEMIQQLQKSTVPWRIAPMAEALGELRDPAAIKPLKKLIYNRDPRIRDACATALGELGATSWKVAFYERDLEHTYAALAESADADSVDMLICGVANGPNDDLANPKVTVKDCAIAGLARTRTREAMIFLLSLRQPDGAFDNDALARIIAGSFSLDLILEYCESADAELFRSLAAGN